MAHEDVTDQDNCLDERGWYDLYGADRFLYLKVTDNCKKEIYIGDDEKYDDWYDTTNVSYYVNLRRDKYEVYISQDQDSSDFWGEYYVYNPKSNTIHGIYIRLVGNADGFTHKCQSTAAGSSDPPIITNDPLYFRDSWDFCFKGEFKKEFSSDGTLKKVHGEVSYIMRRSGSNVAEIFPVEYVDGGDGTGSIPKKTHFQWRTVCIWLNSSGIIAPFIQEAAIPTKDAWVYTDSTHTDFALQREPNIIPDTLSLYYSSHNSGSWYMNNNQDIDMFLMPKKLKWVRPYPYGKWFEKDGEITTRGMPEPLIDDQGAFNKCRNLTSVTIPESVKYIGEFAFRETKLKSVMIAMDCEFHGGSFPYNCKITYYGGGSPVVRDIANLEEFEIRKVETMTIDGMEGK